LYQRKYGTAFHIDVRPVVFVLIILGRGVEVNDVGHGLELGLVRVAGLEADQDLELANVEEVDQTLQLVLWELWAKDEGLHGEPIQEELDAIGLDHIIRIDDCLPLKDAELQEGKEDDKLL